MYGGSAEERKATAVYFVERGCAERGRVERGRVERSAHAAEDAGMRHGSPCT